jgi:RimJ/RimL family protein N-acetyltransferase
MAEIIEFETDRLRLRQWLAKDREPFAALNADPRVMEFFPATLDRATSDAMAEYCERLIAERGWGFWAAEVRAAVTSSGSSVFIFPLPSCRFRLA